MSIRVDIDMDNLPAWAWKGADALQAYIVCQLKEAGVPTVGGPINVQVDFSKGVLRSAEDMLNNKRVYVWEGI